MQSMQGPNDNVSVSGCVESKQVGGIEMQVVSMVAYLPGDSSAVLCHVPLAAAKEVSEKLLEFIPNNA